MKCVKCGAELRSESKFCEMCGSPRPQPAASFPPPAAAAPSNIQFAQEAPKGKSDPLGNILGAVSKNTGINLTGNGKGDTADKICALGSIVFAVLWILDTLIYFFVLKYLRGHYYRYNTPGFYTLFVCGLFHMRTFFNVLCLASGGIALSRRCWLGGAGIVLIIFCYFLSSLLSAFAFDGIW